MPTILTTVSQEAHEPIGNYVEGGRSHRFVGTDSSNVMVSFMNLFG
jgi:hypothetical protein